MTCPVCTGTCPTGTCVSGRLHALVREWQKNAAWAKAQARDTFDSVDSADWEAQDSVYRLCVSQLEAALPPPIDPAQYHDPQYPLLSAYIRRYMEQHDGAALSNDGVCAALEALLAEVRT